MPDFFAAFFFRLRLVACPPLPLALFFPLALLFLGGCGDRPLKEDAAFITFLEERVLAAEPALPLPALTGPEREALGAHAGLYDGMRAFRASMDSLLARDLPRLREAAALESLAAALQGKGRIAEAARSAGELRAALAEGLERALGKRRVMRVSGAVAAAYDAAFERNAARPAREAVHMLGALENYFTSLLDLAELLARSGDGYIVEGARVHITLEDLEPEIRKALAGVSSARAALGDAASRYAEALRGS